MRTAVIERNEIEEIKQTVKDSLEAHGIAILPPLDAMLSLKIMRLIGLHPKVTMLDPWYNKGFGGIRDDYKDFVLGLLANAAGLSDHVFLWGFPEIVAYFVDKLPEPLTLVDSQSERDG